MDTKYQVFISSTYEDLKEERRIVMEQILNLGHIPVGMELFQAGNIAQWPYIRQRILASDYYIVIVAERYGCVGPDGKSYTQMEYEFAVENNVPVAAFLLDDQVRKTWPSDRVEFEKREELDQFRSLCRNRMVKFWKNGDSLGSMVLSTLYGMFVSDPRDGWVKGNSVATEAALNEISKLSEEKRSLQEQVEKYKSKEYIIVPADIQYRIDMLSNIDACTAQAFPPGQNANRGHSLTSLFISMSRNFARDLYYHSAGFVVNSIIEADVDMNVVDEILAEFTTHNLIEKIYIKNDRINFTDAVYRLTDYGKQFVLYAGMAAS